MWGCLRLNTGNGWKNRTEKEIMTDKIYKLFERVKSIYQTRSLQFILSISFTLVSVAVMIGVAAGFSQRFVKSTERLAISNNKNVLDQMNLNLDNYLHNMMSISNTLYYSIIKNVDFGKDSASYVGSQMKLLYEANATSLVSIAIFSDEGELIAAQPLSRTKQNVDPVTAEWFIRANKQIENVHFSTPHVENLFINSDNIYHWVVSLSRSVEMTKDGEIVHGVVLVNMNFTGIEQICKNVDLGESGYVYIVDRSGELIYHPKQQLIYGGITSENNKKAAQYSEGSHIETFQGKERQPDYCNTGRRYIISRRFYLVKKPVQKRHDDHVQRCDKCIFTGRRKLQPISLEIIADKQENPQQGAAFDIGPCH